MKLERVVTLYDNTPGWQTIIKLDTTWCHVQHNKTNWELIGFEAFKLGTRVTLAENNSSSSRMLEAQRWSLVTQSESSAQVLHVHDGTTHVAIPQMYHIDNICDNITPFGSHLYTDLATFKASWSNFFPDDHQSITDRETCKKHALPLRSHHT